VGGSIVRAAQVTCSYVDEDNRPQIITARGFLARALQHEIDHLDGVMYIDRMSAVERLSFASKLKKLAKQNGGVR
jgi:peptide deformylase